MSSELPPATAMPHPKAPLDLDKAVGNNIRLHRMNKNISQTELGSQIGVTFQQVQKYENGTNRVGAGRLQLIARVLGVPVTSLFDDAAEGLKPRSAEESPIVLIANPLALRMARAFFALRNKKLRHSVVELLERIAAADQSAKSARKRRRR